MGSMIPDDDDEDDFVDELLEQHDLEKQYVGYLKLDPRNSYSNGAALIQASLATFLNKS